MHKDRVDKNMKKIILGSQSPRRRELLENAGLRFEVIASDSEEKVDENLDYPDIVMSLAEQKNKAVSSDPHSRGAVVITADTMVVINERIMGKPQNDKEAYEMLSLLSGNTHFVLTGFCICDNESGKRAVGYEKTAVKFRTLDDGEIRNYIKTGEPRDKAGAYGIQLRGSMFVERIEGDYFNIVGLPVQKICKLLKEDFGISLL